MDVWLQDWQSRCMERENAIEAAVWNFFHGVLGCTFPPLFLEGEANFTHPYLAPFAGEAPGSVGRRLWAICHAEKRARETWAREERGSLQCSLGSLPAQRMRGGSSPVSMAAAGLLESHSRCGTTAFRPYPLCAQYLPPVPPDCFPMVKKLVKSERWRGALINET